MRLARLGVQVSVTVAVLALTDASSAHAQAEPPPVRSASLTQQGQDLVWRVRLWRPFSPESLKRELAPLCLVIKWPSGAIRRFVCVAPGRHRRPPLRLMVGDHAIAATVTRPGMSSLQASFLPSAIGIGYTLWRWQVQSALGLFPQVPQPLRLHIPRLVGCVASGPDWVLHGPTNVHDIALTFDDGPWNDTPQFLDVLEREHVVATFFQIGEQIAQYGSVDRRMLRDRDMIGDHTWSHVDVAGDGPSAAPQIGMAASAVRQATGGFTPCLFRAPGGAVSPALLAEARRIGFTTIQWNIDPRDWSLPGVEEIESDVIENAQPGAIVEMHDGGGNRSETLDALPTIISTLRRRGYHFVTVAQMLGYRLLYK